MEGFRTYLVAAFMAAVPSLLEWLGGVDWTSVLTNLGVPASMVVPVSMAISAAIMAYMRTITKTPPGVKPS